MKVGSHAMWICAVWLAASCALEASEPWADSRLPVKEGVELWLDVSRQNAARQAHQLPVLSMGRPVDVCFDGAGGQHDLTQRSPEARPKFGPTSAGGYFRFDGKDDSLAAANLKLSFSNASIFVVAAPRSNAGFFRAFLGLNQIARNDYQSGLNVDLGPGASTSFSVVNVEGPGFGGVANLLSNTMPFRAFHVLSLLCEPETVRLWMDGKAQGQRSRARGLIHMDEVTVGGRCYSNTAEPPHTQGFLDGDIAEVLIFSRALAETDRVAVERYLTEKHAGLRSASEEQVPGGLRFLETVSNPPPVQMFVPGFSVRELPVSLSNINNVKYRPDGKLVALAYNGRIYLLSDSDGDGLEDKADVFWDRDTLRAPIGMALTPPGYSRGEGVFVAAKGKLALIVDRDHDGRADEEIIVASGWKELFHGVDALGVALDGQGNIYFGLGCANFTDAYLIDKATGKTRYDLASERGTILKVSPDFSKREIFCTGIRFPVAMAFNREGDLFSTDQEGATWLANGNPFDELLHIQKGQHYGFPPRHPKHLPNVIDEPSVFDYAPQHQSTCGLNFNEPVNGGPLFGPYWWTEDAIVCGYSRGKLYRTKVLKTDAGYVAQNNLIGCLNMLPADACVTPKGDLVVAAHSGSPDWGSGPEGKGKLYNISYTDSELPQPTVTYAANPTEFRVVFDRPIDAARLKDVSKRTSIVRGAYVGAGDRFESLRPGYQAVQDQLAAPRYDVPVLAVLLSSDQKSLIIRTPPQTAAEKYAITLPGFSESNRSTNGSVGKTKALPQHATIELASDLHGVEAEWTLHEVPGKPVIRGWLPHLSTRVSAVFDLSPLAGEETVFRTQLDLWQMLQSAVQPGSKLDYTPPAEDVTLEFRSPAQFTVKAATQKVKSSAVKDVFMARLLHRPKENDWLPIEIHSHFFGPTPLDVTWHTSLDPRPRALPLRRFYLPWAKPGATNLPSASERIIPEIAGGNWLHGKRLFFGDQLACYKCHQIRSEGGKIGPDLSNLIFRDYASVLHDIVTPNATINPEHLNYKIELKDGDSISGVLQSDSKNEIVLGLVSGDSRRIAKTQIASLKPAGISLMPEGLTQALDGQQLKDLMTFLLTSPLEPSALEITGEPPARSRKEIETALKDSSQGSGVRSREKPLRVLLSAGPKDHGPGEHDYPLWQKRWAKLFRLADNVELSTTSGWPSAADFQKNEVVVLYSNNPGWAADRGAELDAFLNRGGGLVFLHYAVDGHTNVNELSQRIGLAWRGGGSKFRHGPIDLELGDHPLAAGLGKLHFIDESYWQLVGDEKKIQLIASGVEEGKPRPLIWTRDQGKGRVFVSILGHYTWTFDDPLFRILILRGICWSAHEPMDRLSDLATIGARLAN